MCHHSLELRASQPIQGAPRHADHRIARIGSRREGVDPLLLIHDPHLRHRQPGGDRHFLHHIEQAPLGKIRRRRLDRPAAQALGNHLPAPGKLRQLEPAPYHDHPAHDRRNHRRPLAIPPPELPPIGGIHALRVRLTELEPERGDAIHHRNDPDHRKGKPPNEHAARFPRTLLGLEEIHLRNGGSLRTGPWEPRARLPH